MSSDTPYVAATVEMYVEPAMDQQPDGPLAPRVDDERNLIIAYSFRPVQG